MTGKAKVFWKKKTIIFGMAISFFLLSIQTVYAASPWVFQEDGWHYYQEDGQPGVGWVESNGLFYYLLPGGKSVTDTITPDGYYVDANGAWYSREERILGISFTSLERFLPVGGEWDKSPSILLMAERFRQVFGRERRIQVYRDRIEYRVYTAGNGTAGSKTTADKPGTTADSGTPLAALYQEPSQGRYCLELKMKLYPQNEDEHQTATYDYACFKAMLYQISSSPEILEEALLSAWQGDNRFNINRQEWVRAGDAKILYAPGKESGRFYLCPAGEGD